MQTFGKRLKSEKKYFFLLPQPAEGGHTAIVILKTRIVNENVSDSITCMNYVFSEFD